MANKHWNKETFIEEANKIHNNKYDYSKVVWNGLKNQVCIICHELDEFGDEHGEFWQTPEGHLSGRGCKKCAGKYKPTTDEIINIFNKIHHNKYDYSKVKYKNKYTKVCIICHELDEFGHEHGEFFQTPKVHKLGCGCPKCANPNANMTTEEFIKKAKIIHGDKYDYSKVEYKNIKTPVCIICHELDEFGDEHGEWFVSPDHFLYGSKCPKCNGGVKLTKEEFIKKANKIHHNKYDYSKVNYINSKTLVIIICPEHGEFPQTPGAHLQGNGCPICNKGYTSKYKFNLLKEFESEYEFRSFLENNDINILYAILMNIEPKFEPIKKDIERALSNASEINPIEALENKYQSAEEDIENNDIENENIFDNIDWDDDNAVNNIINSIDNTEDKQPSIEDFIKNRDKEIQVIDKIEHLLTPEIREYIMQKFLNDKMREYIANKEANKKD